MILVAGKPHFLQIAAVASRKSGAKNAFLRPLFLERHTDDFNVGFKKWRASHFCTWLRQSYPLRVAPLPFLAPSVEF